MISKWLSETVGAQKLQLEANVQRIKVQEPQPRKQRRIHSHKMRMLKRRALPKRAAMMMKKTKRRKKTQKSDDEI